MTGRRTSILREKSKKQRSLMFEDEKNDEACADCSPCMVVSFIFFVALLLGAVAVLVFFITKGYYESPNCPASPGILTDSKIIDMSHTLDEKSPIWGNHAKYQLKHGFSGDFNGKFWFAYNTLVTPEHIGTHIDAPAHFVSGTHTIQELPVTKLIGEAVCLHFEQQASKNSDFQVKTADIEKWETANGNITHDSIVIIAFGWYHRWPNATSFFGSKDISDFTTYHHPGIHPDAALFLWNQRKVKAVATDAPALDYGQTSNFKAHKILNMENIPIISAVRETDNLPVKDFTLFALPMPIKYGTAAPTRVVAVLKNT